MIRNTYGHKLWTFPGGGIKKGESAESAAKRETYEEVGIKVDEPERIGEFLTTSEYKEDFVTVFQARSGVEKFEIDGGEILEAGWYSLDNFPDISEYAKRIVSMLK